MKIGDRVRFLNEVGGGIISGFQGKDTILVEDEDGFDIPVLRRECVVVATDDYNNAFTPEEIIKQEVTAESNRDDALDTVVVETKQGNVLNAYLAFVPQDIKQLSTTSFDTYLVNDSNYFMYYTYSNQVSDGKWSVRSHDLIAPNTKLYIETFTKGNLNELERVRIQLISFKHDRNYIMKEPVDKLLSVDTVKFYKLHAFKENDFFADPAIVFTIVENDQEGEELSIDTTELKEKMMSRNNEETNQKKTPEFAEIIKQKGKHAVVEVDLHIDELIDSTKGLDAKDMLDCQMKKFHEVMDKYRTTKNQKIVFIHGKGEGVLRKSILQSLKKEYKSCTYQDASFQEYGFGATMITIH